MSLVSFSESEIKQIQQHYKNLVVEWTNLDYCDNCLEEFPLSKNDYLDECVFCSLCNGMIHQRCYGDNLLGKIPSGNWFCGRCEILISKYNKKYQYFEEDYIKCQYCPNLKGIMKIHKINKQKVMSHVCCSNVLFGHRQKLKERFQKKRSCVGICHICNYSYGRIMNCSFDECNYKFHVTCAREIGILTKYTMQKEKKEPQDILCPLHSKQMDPDLYAHSKIQAQYQSAYKQQLVYRFPEKQETEIYHKLSSNGKIEGSQIPKKLYVELENKINNYSISQANNNQNNFQKKEEKKEYRDQTLFDYIQSKKQHKA